MLRKSRILKFVLCFSTLFLIAGQCDDDDGGIPQADDDGGAVMENKFSIGADTYDLDEGFKGVATNFAPGGFSTFFTFTADGLTVENADYSGRGNFVALEFYTSTSVLGDGTYPIDNSENPNTVEVTYALDFDAANPFFPPQNVFNGTVDFERVDDENFIINVTGVDNDSGQTFRASYSGLVTTVQ
ncbi:hypothetical protein BST97_00410 [Nonlabens spongiae]|uniref:DUF5017 domain-containing protein n=1 Tax=Nonlabens spongiae TaxID=331648 RepID=A0A1W6MG58_9FLAO|nr:hypothetical protein [Nonlabens spongiae]ARN76588.1 hypothetical protein BST97_00410 [Nonlabens spongiae]